ncbi:MAG: J domain-containing protein [Chloroflexi bacterium]|nr:J domain-containing protein [Chloroflexota bacterium]
MKQFVLDHLIQECRQADRVIACTQQKDSDLSIKLKNGKMVNVFVINRAIRLPEIKETYEGNTSRGVHTLFILDARMLPLDNSRIEPPPHWMEVLHTLTCSRIYTYHLDGRSVTIRPLHIEWRWGDAPRFVEYGEIVNINDLHTDVIESNSKLITGRFAAANFGEGSFWKKKAPLEEAQYRYSWRNWSYSEKKSTRQEEETPSGWSSWEEFSRNYGDVGGSDEPQWDWAGEADKNRQQRRTRKSAAAEQRQHYAVLGVSAEASFEEVKQAYRKKAREYHPDLHPTEKEKYTAKMAEINTAFEAITKQKQSK